MEIKVPMEEMRKKRLFIGTPMYGGNNHGLYLKSVIDLNNLCAQAGIEVRYSFLFNESLITRARNYIVDEFLRSGFTHLLFIDADIQFEAKDVLTLLALDKDIIGGPYPKKSIYWTRIHDVVTQGKLDRANANSLENLTGDYVFNILDKTEKFNVFEPVRVKEIGTGFMMINRNVFTKFAQKFPEKRYRPDHLGQENFDGSREIVAFFDTVIDRNLDLLAFLEKFGKVKTEDEATNIAKEVFKVVSDPNRVIGSNRYLSEDYMFCQYSRKIGFDTWLCPWMKLTHIGTYTFKGDLPLIANTVGKLRD